MEGRRQYTREHEGRSLRDINLSLKEPNKIVRRAPPQNTEPQQRWVRPMPNNKKASVRFTLMENGKEIFFANDKLIWPPAKGDSFKFKDNEYEAIKILRILIENNTTDCDSFAVVLEKKPLAEGLSNVQQQNCNQ
jgi:hypothetical protein